MDRLAALIPPPRRHRHRYYDQRKSLWDGVLAPNSPLRPAVTALAAAPKPVPVEAETVAEESPVSRAARYVWATLLARIYEVFPLTCPQCGGTMRIIAFIDDPTEVKKILTHLGEPTAAPYWRRRAARRCGRQRNRATRATPTRLPNRCQSSNSISASRGSGGFPVLRRVSLCLRPARRHPAGVLRGAGRQGGRVLWGGGEKRTEFLG